MEDTSELDNVTINKDNHSPDGTDTGLVSHAVNRRQYPSCHCVSHASSTNTHLQFKTAATQLPNPHWNCVNPVDCNSSTSVESQRRCVTPAQMDSARSLNNLLSHDPGFTDDVTGNDIISDMEICDYHNKFISNKSQNKYRYDPCATSRQYEVTATVTIQGAMGRYRHTSLPSVTYPDHPKVSNSKDVSSRDLSSCDIAWKTDTCRHVISQDMHECKTVKVKDNAQLLPTRVCPTTWLLILSSLFCSVGNLFSSLERYLCISTITSCQKSWVRISQCIIVLSVMCPTNGLPADVVHKRDVDSQPTTKPIDPTNYLMKYGFLPQAMLETEALRTQEELEEAVRGFQRFANLPETGEFDQDTMDKMHAPRCGVADVVDNDAHASRHHHGDHRRAKRYVLGPSKWEKQALTFRILNYTPDLSQAEVQDAIRRAFLVWTQVTHLTFHEVYYGDADIFIKFARYYHTDGYPFDGPGMILAHAFFPGEERGGDVHFDEDETWSRRSHDGTNLFSVAAHEIGHALGLAHSDVLGALMYPWYQGYMANFQLHHDDINAIQYLYGRKEFEFPKTPEQPSYTVRPEYPTYPPRTPERTEPPAPTTPWVRPTRPPRPTTTTTTRAPHRPHDPNQPPDPCTTTIDAVGNIRSEIMVFKGKWFWRIDENGVMANYPVELNRLWFGLPHDFSHVDAVYERPYDGKIVFFKGDRYYVFSANELDFEYRPHGRPITELGLPRDVKRVDAAFVWGWNRKTYFITGDMYWRYNEALGHMDFDYPRDMTMWQGVRLPVDAVFRDLHGLTHFVKGHRYWQFNDGRMETRSVHKHFGADWLGCDAEVTFTPQYPPFEGDADARKVAGSAPTINVSIMLILVTGLCQYACSRVL